MKSFIRASALFLSVIFTCRTTGDPSRPGDGVLLEIARLPRIRPDWSGAVIPPNIAPLNFMLDEPAGEFLVDMGIADGSVGHLQIRTKRNKVVIPAAKWRRLLSACRGRELRVDVRARDAQNRWRRYRPISMRVAMEKIDSHVVYRLINPAYSLWWNMGIHQRNLEDFHEEALFTNRVTGRNCMNCHSFCNHRPEKMLFHMRAEYAGTMLVTGGQAAKVDTRTDQTLSSGVYPAWHPAGHHVAFSVNQIEQTFHARKGRSIHVYDKASDLVVYDVRTNTVRSSLKVSTRRLENLPAWSPDGGTLYFCSGPEWKEGTDIRTVRYDLMRIACDVETNRWGEVETVLSSAETGKSISFPRVSPDGRFMMFCMSDYGYFAIHNPASDLYLLDLGTREYRRLDVNSESSESYHCWSSEGRWFVFASKREDGLCSRLFISYLDSTGNAHKPFLMPQKDPAFYDAYVMNFNAPEMISGPVKASRWTLMNAALRPPVKARFVPMAVE